MKFTEALELLRHCRIKIKKKTGAGGRGGREAFHAYSRQMSKIFLRSIFFYRTYNTDFSRENDFYTDILMF
jgi:hypothetical protein